MRVWCGKAGEFRGEDHGSVAGPLRRGGEEASKRGPQVSGRSALGAAERGERAGLACGRRGLRALARGRAGSLGRGERRGGLGLGSGKREGGSDGPDWVVLGWAGVLVSFPFLFPILLLSKSNSNKV